MTVPNGKWYVTYPVFISTMLVIVGAIFWAMTFLFSDLKRDIRADYTDIKEEIRLLRTNK